MPSRGPTGLPEAGEPLVGRIGDLAVWLGVPVERAAAVTATLDPWGTHASGEPVCGSGRSNVALAALVAGHVACPGRAGS